MESSEADVGGWLGILSAALTPLTTGVSTIWTAFAIVYRISFLLGQFVTHTLLTTFQLVFAVVQGLATAILVLFEDFRYFASDLEFYIATFFSLLTDGIDWLFGVFAFLYSLPSSLSTPSPVRLIKEPLETVVSSLVNWTLTFKASLILIGELFWGITVFFLEFLKTIFILTPIAVCKFVWGCTTALDNFIWSCFYDVPFESACGLVIAYILYYVFISYGGHYLILAYLDKICCRLANALSTIYIGILVTFHFFAWQLASALWRVGTVRRIVKIISSKKAISANPLSASLIVELELERAEKMCVACMDKKKTILIQDCNHLCLCIECAEAVYEATRRCPICRAPISSMVNVYV